MILVIRRSRSVRLPITAVVLLTYIATLLTPAFSLAASRLFISRGLSSG